MWTADLRRRFAIAYLIYGFMLTLLTLETISAIQGRNPIIAVGAAVTAAVLGFYVARMVYRQLWHEWHLRKVTRGEKAEREGDDSANREPSGSGPAVTSGRTWVWDAVRTNRVLTPEERATAQAEAGKLLWGPLRLFGNIFWPGTFALGILFQLVNRHHTPVQTTILVMGLLIAAATQWGFVMQSRLRRWMSANHLTR